MPRALPGGTTSFAPLPHGSYPPVPRLLPLPVEPTRDRALSVVSAEVLRGSRRFAETRGGRDSSRTVRELVACASIRRSKNEALCFGPVVYDPVYDRRMMGLRRVFDGASEGHRWGFEGAWVDHRVDHGPRPARSRARPRLALLSSYLLLSPLLYMALQARCFPVAPPLRRRSQRMQRPLRRRCHRCARGVARRIPGVLPAPSLVPKPSTAWRGARRRRSRFVTDRPVWSHAVTRGHAVTSRVTKRDRGRHWLPAGRQ